MRAAGFEEFPKDLAGYLKLCQGLKKAGKPPASRSATRPATPTAGSNGACGRMAAKWSTTRTMW